MTLQLFAMKASDMWNGLHGIISKMVELFKNILLLRINLFLTAEIN